MSKRLSKEDCINRLIGRPITIIDYAENTRGKTLFACTICGKEWCTSFANVASGHGCPVCENIRATKKRVLSEELVQFKLKDRGIQLLRYEGTVMSSDSLFKCDTCLHIWKARLNNIDQGQGCPKCSGRLCITKDQCHSRISNKPFIMLQYAGKLLDKSSLFECSLCGYKWNTSFANAETIKNCPKCSKAAKVTLSKAISRLTGTNVELVAYSGNVKGKSTFKCGHCLYLWDTPLDGVQGCPACAKSGFNPTKPAWLYTLLINTHAGYCYGFGITNNIKDRMKKHRINLKGMLDQEYEPLYFDSGVEAQQVESLWKKSPYVINGGVEGFKTECVLVNNETTKMIFG